MATLSITVDDLIIPRLRAAYGVDTNGQIKNAIIKEIKNKVKAYEVEQIALIEQAKVVAAETAKRSATAAAEQLADQEVVIT